MTRQTSIVLDGKKFSPQIEESTDEHITALIACGYGKNLTEVIRHAVREAWERQQPSIVECSNESSRFGWAYSTAPTGNGPYSIKIPSSPDYEGTLDEIREAQQNDRTFNSLGGAFYSTAWFYGSRRIIATWDFGMVGAPSPDDAANMDDKEYYEKCEYGWTWIPGFQPSEDETTFKLLVE